MVVEDNKDKNIEGRFTRFAKESQKETELQRDERPLRSVNKLGKGLEAGEGDSSFFRKNSKAIGGEDRKEALGALKVLYERAIGILEDIYSTARAGNKFEISSAESLVVDIVEDETDSDSLFIYALHHHYTDKYFLYHPVNVAIFSIRLARGLDMAHEKIIELGLSALLHDIGMVKFPEELVLKSSRFSRNELEIFRKRPVYSYEILKPFSQTHPYLAETALQVHERVDGSGYPHGLKGEEINEYAKIIGLVDVYEAMIHDRPQRERFLHFKAVKEIIKKEKHGFERAYLKALLNVFSIFPLYSYVKLNSGAIGKVIKTDVRQPLRPVVKIVLDSQGNRLLTERIVDLSEHPLLYIIDSISEDEIFEKKAS